jgi:uncharacterized protein YlzI (FlbEa/FlbD family)
MFTFSTGGEPDHMVWVNPNNVSHVIPKGKNFTYIHMSNGDKHMVDAKFNDVVTKLHAFLEHVSWQCSPGKIPKRLMEHFLHVKYSIQVSIRPSFALIYAVNALGQSISMNSILAQSTKRLIRARWVNSNAMWPALMRRHRCSKSNTICYLMMG